MKNRSIGHPELAAESGPHGARRVAGDGTVNVPEQAEHSSQGASHHKSRGDGARRMSSMSLGIEGCASWAPKRTGGRRMPTLTAMEHYRMNASRPLTEAGSLGPATFPDARLSYGDGGLPPLSPEPVAAASRVTPSYVHERDETERLGAGAPVASGVPGPIAGPPALTTTVGSSSLRLSTAPRTLNYMCDPHRLGTHQRQKGYASPPPRTAGSPVQYDSMYGLPVRYTNGDMFSGSQRLLGQANRGGIQSVGSSTDINSGRQPVDGRVQGSELTGRSLQQDSYRTVSMQTLRPMARSKSTEPPRISARALPQSWLFQPHTKARMEFEAPELQSHFMLG